MLGYPWAFKEIKNVSVLVGFLFYDLLDWLQDRLEFPASYPLTWCVFNPGGVVFCFCRW